MVGQISQTSASATAPTPARTSASSRAPEATDTTCPCLDRRRLLVFADTATATSSGNCFSVTSTAAFSFGPATRSCAWPSSAAEPTRGVASGSRSPDADGAQQPAILGPPVSMVRDHPQRALAAVPARGEWHGWPRRHRAGDAAAQRVEAQEPFIQAGGAREPEDQDVFPRARRQHDLFCEHRCANLPLTDGISCRSQHEKGPLGWMTSSQGLGGTSSFSSISQRVGILV